MVIVLPKKTHLIACSRCMRMENKKRLLSVNIKIFFYMKSFNFSLFLKITNFLEQICIQCWVDYYITFFYQIPFWDIYIIITIHSFIWMAIRTQKYKKKIQKKKKTKKGSKYIFLYLFLYFSTAEKCISRYNAFVFCLLLISIGKSEIEIPGGTFFNFNNFDFSAVAKIYL